MKPILFEITIVLKGITIYSYDFFIFLSISFSYIWFIFILKQFKLNFLKIAFFLISITALMFLGARALFIILNLNGFMKNPFDYLKFETTKFALCRKEENRI